MNNKTNKHMSTTFIESITLAKIECGMCGAAYAINERFRAKKEQEGGGWHCPYCQCGWGYFNDNENARLRRELTAQKCETMKERLAREEAQAAVAKAIAAENKLRRRIQGGVCPCCKRTFKQLAAHMAAKHPEQNQPEEKLK